MRLTGLLLLSRLFAARHRHCCDCPAQPRSRAPSSPRCRSRAWTCPGGAPRFEAKQAELRQTHPRLIFLGDSITQNWERHGPPRLGRVRAGLAALLRRPRRGGPRLQRRHHRQPDLADRNGELGGISPKVAVVLIGANNLGYLHWSADGHCRRDRYDHRRTAPAACRTPRCCCWACCRRNAPPGPPRPPWRSIAAWRRNTRAATVVTFLDAGHVFLRDGKLDRALFYDPQADPARGAAASHRAGHGAAWRPRWSRRSPRCSATATICSRRSHA